MEKYPKVSLKYGKYYSTTKAWFQQERGPPWAACVRGLGLVYYALDDWVCDFLVGDGHQPHRHGYLPGTPAAPLPVPKVARACSSAKTTKPPVKWRRCSL